MRLAVCRVRLRYSETHRSIQQQAEAGEDRENDRGSFGDRRACDVGMVGFGVPQPHPTERDLIALRA